MAKLEVGDKAPDFTLLDQDGNKVKLSEQVKKHRVHIAYFYPQRWSRRVSTARSMTGNLRT